MQKGIEVIGGDLVETTVTAARMVHDEEVDRPECRRGRGERTCRFFRICEVAFTMVDTAVLMQLRNNRVHPARVYTGLPARVVRRPAVYEYRGA